MLRTVIAAECIASSHQNVGWGCTKWMVAHYVSKLNDVIISPFHGSLIIDTVCVLIQQTLCFPPELMRDWMVTCYIASYLHCGYYMSSEHFTCTVSKSG